MSGQLRGGYCHQRGACRQRGSPPLLPGSRQGPLPAGMPRPAALECGQGRVLRRAPDWSAPAPCICPRSRVTSLGAALAGAEQLNRCPDSRCSLQGSRPGLTVVGAGGLESDSSGTCSLLCDILEMLWLWGGAEKGPQGHSQAASEAGARSAPMGAVAVLRPPAHV